MSLSPRRAVFAFAIFSVFPVLVGCPKKPDPVPDAAPPPPPVEEASTTVLVPMEEDAGAADADADAPVKYTGPAVNPNVAKLKQCCNAIAAEGKRLGASPEGAMLTTAAAQCSQAATQIGPQGTAPEMAVLRQMLAGRALPGACAGL